MKVLEMFDLTGKLAVITGGAGRYGSQMTEALAEAGATVYTASRSLEKNEVFAATLRERGLDVRAESYDQGDEESIKALLARLVEKHDKVDILVNNSVSRPNEDGFYASAKFFEDSMKINATGLFLISRTFGKHMAENGKGSIINIGSYMGELSADSYLYEEVPAMSAFESPDYFFHKGGMDNLTRLMAGYYGPSNVRVNCVSLGGLFNNQDPSFLKRYAKRTFLGRMANDTDIKGIIVYLASDASAYTTGAIIPIDGGYSAK